MNKSTFFVLLIVWPVTALAACTGGPTLQENGAALPLTDTQTLLQTSAEPASQVQPAPDASLETSPPGANASNADLFTVPITAAGDVVIFSGRVLDVHGGSLEGATVEIWQTDVSGVYDHPADLGTNSRDVGFQFYGAAVTDAQGMYTFRTIVPGRYEPRPPHIHFKVTWKGAALLTSQIYFADTGSEGGTSTGIDTDPLVMKIEQASAKDDSLYGSGTFDIVVDTGAGAGPLRLTPGQGEGPYYPLAVVAEYDNDLASVTE